MELDQLDGLVNQADAGASQLDAPMAGEGGQLPAAPQGPDFNMEARGMVDMFAALVVGYAPKAEPLWGEGTKARVSMALAPVLEKYGFSMGAMPCELTLIVVAGPVLWQTSRVVAAQMAQDKPKPKAKDPAAQVADPITAATAPIDQAQPPAPDDAPAAAPAPAVHPQMALYQKK